MRLLKTLILISTYKIKKDIKPAKEVKREVEQGIFNLTKSLKS